MRGNFDMKGLSGKLTLVLTFGIIVMNYQAKAQNRGIFIPYSTVGFGLGTSNYYGDLATYRKPVASTFNMMRWSVGANYTRHFTPRLAARAAFNYARIAGDDYVMNRKSKDWANTVFARNLNFRNDLKEFSIQGIYKLIPDNRNYDRRPQFGAYLFLGIGLTAHNPKALYVDSTGSKEWVNLKPLHTEGQENPGYAKAYSLVNLVVPFGVGLRYKINSNFDISAEVGFRYTFTDYLDDVSGNYADPALFSDPVALALSNRTAEQFTARKHHDRTEGLKKFLAVNYPALDQSDPVEAMKASGFASAGQSRGNRFKDQYMLCMIHVHYMLPTKIKCPPLK